MRTLITFLLINITSVACSAERPNIILIISDDQNYRDFGFMGNRQVQTPNLDRLASESATYVNGYVPSSVCSPSLATILTGRYPHEHGIHYNHPPPGNAAFNRMASRAEYDLVRSESFRLIRAVDTLPRLLRDDAGYRCLQTGKFWEGHYKNAGFTHGMTKFTPVPGQEFGGNRKLASGELAAHGNGDWGLKIGRQTMQPIYDFIDQADAAPFLIWYAPYLPHQPHDSPERYYDLYDGHPVSANRLPYYAAISQFDETVGQLIEHVEARELASDTLFLFIVDNGWVPGQVRAKGRPEEFDHTKRSKRAPFDDGLRTPILIRWDGHTKARMHHGLVSSIDIMPTLLTAVGLANKAKDLPGLNLLPSACGRSSLDARRAVFGEIYPGDATSLDDPSADIAYRWVRRGDWKLITTHSHNGKPPWGSYLVRDAMFNVVDDPGETKNLINDSRYSTRQQVLRRFLFKWWSPGQ